MTAQKRQKGLGRGLDALLGEDTATAAPATTQATQTLPVEQLQAGKYQPRSHMDESALAELAQSIRDQGVMQPILVRPIAPKGTVRYEIIAGERRFRASQLAGLTQVPVLIREVPDEQAAVMALIENLQREDLNALEQAHGIQRLIQEFSMTHEQAAQAVGRSRSATSNLLRLLNLAQPVQNMLLAGDLEMGHARALLAVDAATQITLGNQIVAKRLSVREAEKLVTKVAQEFALQAPPARKGKSRDVARLEEQLSDALGTTVTIKVNARNKGQLLINFHNLDGLDAIVTKLLPHQE